MGPVRRAVIDVGTNSIKLLVAEVDGLDVHPLLEQSKQTRLGQGFYPDHILQPGPIAQTTSAITEFAAQADKLGAGRPQVVATSAVREAQNQKELISAVKEGCRLAVRVLSGDEEAGYGFQGVTSDSRLAQESLLLLDVGGGSTEFMVGHHKKMEFAQSFQVGTVRLLERLRPGDSPAAEQLAACRHWVRGFLEKEVGPRVRPELRQNSGRSDELLLVGIGGTSSILGCLEIQLTSFDRDRLEAVRLSRERLHWHVEHLWGLPSAERRKLIGLPPNRADVILTGTVIYEAVMDFFGFNELRISTRGLRFGILMQEK